MKISVPYISQSLIEGYWWSRISWQIDPVRRIDVRGGTLQGVD